jgi:hypothetical protein
VAVVSDVNMLEVELAGVALVSVTVVPGVVDANVTVVPGVVVTGVTT